MLDGEILRDSVHDCQVLRQVSEDIRFDHFEEHLLPRCCCGRNIGGANRCANTGFGKNVIGKIDLILFKRSFAKIIRDELDQLITSHCVNTVLQTLQSCAILRREIRIPCEDLSHLLQAWNLRNKFDEVSTATSIRGKQRKSD